MDLQKSNLLINLQYPEKIFLQIDFHIKPIQKKTKKTIDYILSNNNYKKLEILPPNYTLNMRDNKSKLPKEE